MILSSRPRRARLVVALIVALAASLGWSQGRLPGEHVTKLRPDRWQTPCRPFAADYAKGPLKVLFFVAGYSGVGGREVAELKQRFALEVEGVIYDGSHTVGGRNCALSTDDFWVAPIQGTYTHEKLAVLYGLLEKRWDAFVFGNTSFETLSPRAKYGILKQASEGAGLIFTEPRFAPATLRAKPLTASPRAILAGVPFPLLPSYTAVTKIRADKLPDGALSTFAFGQGRVALWAAAPGGGYWTGYHSLTPGVTYTFKEDVYYDYYLSAIAKLLLWAAPGKAPAIVPAPVNTTEAVTLTWADLPSDVTCGTFSIADGMKVECRTELRDLFGTVTPLPAQTPTAGPWALKVKIPQLPQGDYFVDYRFVSPAGTEAWGSYGVAVRNAPASVADIIVGRARFARTDPFVAQVKLAAPPPEKTTAVAQGFDREGRLIFAQELKVRKEGFEITGDLGLCRMIPHHLRVELRVDGRPADVARQEFLVARPPPDFPVMNWGGMPTTIMGHLMYGQLHRAGFNIVLGDDPAFKASEDMIGMEFATHIRFPVPTDKEPDCGFCNPEWAQKYATQMQDLAKKNLPYGVYSYSLGDENSFTYTRERLAPSELRAFQQYLAEVYQKDVALLNREWGTTYQRFEDVPAPDVAKPMTFADIPRKHLWMTFCEKLYADAHRLLAKAINDIDPQTLVGAEGSVPGDLEVTLEGQGMWGPYPNRLDNVMMRSFARSEVLRGNWWGSYTDKIIAKGQDYWDQVLSGGVNSCFYWYVAGMFCPDMSFADYVQDYHVPALREINAGIGPLLRRTPAAKMGIGLFHSMPSQHALTLDTRFGAPGSCRDGLLKFFEENGVSAFFYSAKQVQAGKLKQDGVRLLFLPQTLCLSDETAAQLRAWVEAGGVLVADQQTGLRTERGVPRQAGVLDDVLGVKQDPLGELLTATCAGELLGARVQWDRTPVDRKVGVTTGKATLTLPEQVPLAITNRYAKGRTVLLNVALGKVLANYGSDAATRTFMLALLDQAGVFAKLQVPTGYWVTRFQGDGFELLSCRQSSDGKDGEKLVLGQEYRVYDVRRGQDLGTINELVPTACAGRNNLFTLLPRQAADFKLALPKSAKAGTVAELTIAQVAARDRCVADRLYRIEVCGPDGKDLPALQSFAGGKDRVKVPLPLALNQADGTHTVRVVDVLTGARQELGFTVKGGAK